MERPQEVTNTKFALEGNVSNNELNAAGIVWDIDEAGDVVVLVVDVEYNARLPNEMPVTKFPGGGRKKDFPAEKSGDPRATGARELFEETGYRVTSLDHLYLVESHFTKKRKPHMKYWYAIHRRYCVGELNTEPVAEERSVVSPPYWIKLKLLLPRIVPTHRRAVFAFHKYLVDLNIMVSNPSVPPS